MDSFEKRKKNILSKTDKSSKGSWDSRIIELCEKINSLEDYYTTSSCSGKCVIMEEKTGKDGSYYIWSSHELLDLDELRGVVLEEFEQEGIVKFKLQSPVLFVACRDVDSAEKLFSLVRDAGFKESGIHITKKLVGVEVRSGEKLEFPLIDSGKFLVREEFFDVLANLANFKLKSGWEKLEKFSGLL